MKHNNVRGARLEQQATCLDGGRSKIPKRRRRAERTRCEGVAVAASVRVEVCLGPDCQGGATLLEIEELVSSAGTKSPRPRTHREVTVCSTGCRDFCTVGPNVYVKSDLADEHFTRVDGPRACRKVVSSILADDASGRDEVLSSTQALLKRREDGIRWRRHKERVCREKRLRVLKREVK